MMKNFKGLLAFYLITLVFSSSAFSQNVLDDLGGGAAAAAAPDLAVEKVEKISQSKRIFIITNSNSSFDKGDFISLLLDSKLAARALVAKTTESGVAGIKITKIYSLALWKQLRDGLEVQVLRGDDSYYKLKRDEAKKSDENEGIIKSEEDLFNETSLLEDDLSLEENSNRIIKQDNVVSATMASIEGIDNDGSSQRYTQFNVQWAYQLEDNIWAEFSYGQNIIDDFPNPGLQTKMTNITLRAKYTISAPFFSYVQPYIGYQIVGASAPGAGEEDPDNPDIDLDAELNRLEDLKKSNVIFGMTILKRLVPGWFIRGDLGSDIIGVGFGLEF